MCSKICGNQSLSNLTRKAERGSAKKGAMSEWLGTGLQNRLHQFESVGTSK